MIANHEVTYTLLPGGKYGCSTCGQEVYRTLNGTSFGHYLTPDPLIEAVIAREVADDDYAAEEYRWATMDVDRELGFGYRFWRAHDRRQAIEKAAIDARMAAMIEGDAAGLFNLFDKGIADTDENLQALARFVR